MENPPAERKSASNIVVDENGNIICNRIYGLKICIGDYVEVYPRARGLAHFSGIIKEITPVSIVLENEHNDISVRLADIKLIRKPKVSKS